MNIKRLAFLTVLNLTLALVVLVGSRVAAMLMIGYH